MSDQGSGAHPPPPPPSAYATPAFTAPYVPAARGSFPPPAPSRTGTPGVIALVLAACAAVGASAVGAVAAFQIGAGTDAGAFAEWSSGPGGLAILTPVRDWVLLAEIAFWVGTVLGTWGFVQGIVATASRRGRTAGIFAVIVAAIGPVIFFVACAVALAQGLQPVPGTSA